MIRIFLTLFLSVGTALVGQDSQLPGEELYQPDVHYEKVGSNLYRSMYRLSPTTYTNRYWRERPTVQNWLESEDITFGEGTSVKFDEKTQILEVVQTLDQLAVIEAVVGVNAGIVSIAIFADVYEVPVFDALDLISDFEEHPNQTECYSKLKQQEKNGTAKNIVSLSSMIKSGTRGKIEIIHGNIIWTEFSEKEGEEEKLYDTEIPYGTIFEFDPVLGVDNETIDLNFSFSHDTAKPEVHDDQTLKLFRNIVTTQLALKTGDHFLGGTWRPSGPNYEDKEVIHLLFFYAKTTEVGASQRVIRNVEK